jgi:haloacetate dehalogenase
MDKAYDIPATWAPRLKEMEATAIPGGHFFIDQSPKETLAALQAFLGAR